MNPPSPADNFTIEVRGEASGKRIALVSVPLDTDQSIMEILHANGIPIASSCKGEGICQKCVVNDTMLSCMTLPQEFVKNTLKPENYMVITVAYL